MFLKELRTKSNLTQQQLADACGVKRNTIAMIEIGKNQPSVKLAKKLSEVLGVSWEKFFE